MKRRKAKSTKAGGGKLAAALRERDEALEFQHATAEILASIRSSATDAGPVFDAIARNVLRLFGTRYAAVFLLRGDMIELATVHGDAKFARRLGSTYRQFRDSFPQPVDYSGVTGKALRSGKIAQLAPIIGNPEATPRAVELAKGFGYDATVVAPLVREGRVIGCIGTVRPDPKAFSEKELRLLKTFADQAVIAIENARLFNETRESLERQTATADILRVISGSPTEVQPVFDVIVERAVRLCGARFGRVYRYDGGTIHMVASHGLSVGGLSEVQRVFPRPASDDTIVGRVIISRQPYLIADIAQDASIPPLSRKMIEALATHSQVTIPMLRAGEPIGAITMGWEQPNGYDERKIALLRTFADQAVIAIENARLFNETKEALERQTATSEVLKAISRTTFDLNAVLQVLIENATGLAGATQGFIFRFDGELARLAFSHNAPPAYTALIESNPISPGRGSLVGRTLQERRPVHIPDVLADSEFTWHEAQKLGGFRSMLGVPMLREGRPIGVIAMWSDKVGSFSEKQIELASTFADQAVIAIENVRLFNETKEALEQQTATAEILKVISSTPTDVQPVFEAIVRAGIRLFENAAVAVARPEGDEVRLMAIAEHDPALAARWKAAFPFRIGHGFMHGAAMLDRAMVEMEDALVDDGRFAEGKRNFAATGYRAMTVVPMIKDGAAVGTISVVRVAPGLLSEKQKNLLRTFADQAVIAIENVRLFKELEARNKDLGESLEQQKASAEVLDAISSSIADTQPVFDRILKSCERLFGVRVGGITILGEDGKLHLRAFSGPAREEFDRMLFPMSLDGNAGNAVAFMERRILHIPDSEAEGVPAGARHGHRSTRTRASLFAPMLWQDAAIGTIFVSRERPGPYSEKEITLLKTFADQAVIAIENVRLFREIQEKSAQLEVANKHKSDFLANMSHELRTPLNAIIGFSEVLSERMFGEINEKQADYLKDIHESGRHLLSLINDILDLSKIEAGRMDLEVSSFHLPSAISNAMTLVRERAQRHGVQLGAEVDARLGEVQADERKVKQILLNLLSNAVKFTPEGGRVDVSAKLDTDKVEIAVTDTGVGISAEDQALLFEEFRQVGMDAARKAEGTGLGLALTKKFVELHGGEIRVDSAPGKGSVFSFTLPLR